MILDTSGNVYGTNSGGGLYNGGTAFELIQSNGKWTLQVLIAFKPTKLGNVAPNGLILGKSGILYGSTYGGGAHFNGSIFELIPNNGTWTEKLLFSFNHQTDGSAPSHLILDASENLYGTTPFGGTYGYGIVFKITP